jgi:hypothetical protein
MPVVAPTAVFASTTPSHILIDGRRRVVVLSCSGDAAVDGHALSA